MASVNNNASVVVVGRTAPVPPGQQKSSSSVPVVIASDQSPIPVEEQNKQQSEVALSLLGIPRSEVALGIFADVNTYDVNPTEWSTSPEQFSSVELYDPLNTTEFLEKYEGLGNGEFDWGLSHISEEAGAMIEAPPGEVTILTSKRFFRYQPGRVSAATFGVKLTRAPYTIYDSEQTDLLGYDTNAQVRNPSIKKYGIFDKFDGYYFESRNDGYGDNFSVVRRTQSIIRENPLPFGNTVGFQEQDYEWVGVPLTESSNAATYPVAYEVIKANKRYLQEVAVNSGLVESNDQNKCRRDVGLIIEGLLHDLKYGGNASTVYNTYRFFKKTAGAPVLYIDDIQAELDRYNAVNTAIASLLSNGSPAAINSIQSWNLSALAINSGTIESGASARVNALLIGILRTAINGPNYSSIPAPVGSAAGEMCVMRDGLIMTHAAAHDPSLLKPKTNYSITRLIEGSSGFNLKVQIAKGDELLQLGQAVRFNKNQVVGSFNTDQPSPNNIIHDDSYWYVASIPTHVVESNILYQIISLQLNPSNEENYTSTIQGGNTTNGWGSDSDLAYGNAGLINITGANDRNGALTATGTAPNRQIDVSSLKFTIETPVPFVLPNDVDNGRPYTGIQYTDSSLETSLTDEGGYVDGAFPYLYPPGSGYTDPSNSKGYIDSAYSNPDDLKSQMNYVNKRLYKNWCWFNVDPKYYKVYEYRIPRSRMSGEKLNGIPSAVVYSDNVLDFKAGDPVNDPTTLEQKTFESVWKLDPTKVTMYKIEFSWYGAVGATFLAYVPVENNEARWVRVHHLRASNQLKVASLGNATLPITYSVYGGGGQYSYGYLNESKIPNTESGYGSFSEQLTKYGASYYIDGGDRGTVRLFSYAADSLKDIGGSKYLFTAANNASAIYSSAGATQATTVGANYVNAPTLTFTETLGSGSRPGVPAISDYYMGAKVITGNLADQDVRVVWVDTTAKRLYLSRTLTQTSGDVRIIVDRPQPLVGIRCRKEINGVRNRVQIYPTRLATGSTGSSQSLVLQILKTPVFQTFTTPGAGKLSVNDFIDIGKRGKKTLLPNSQITLTGGQQLTNNGDSLWGYFRYTIKGDTSGLAYTTLGLLLKENGNYYFSAYEVSVDDILIRGTFLPAKSYTGPGGSSGIELNPGTGIPSSAFPRNTLSRLSAVETDSEKRSPIPGTGTVVTTLFSPNSGQEYELSPYFDYNKDYLSFPLTDIEDTLYVCASSKDDYESGGIYSAKGSILASITWEEQ